MFEQTKASEREMNNWLFHKKTIVSRINNGCSLREHPLFLEDPYKNIDIHLCNIGGIIIIRILPLMLRNSLLRITTIEEQASVTSGVGQTGCWHEL